MITACNGERPVFWIYRNQLSREILGWEKEVKGLYMVCISVVEHLASMCYALGLCPSTKQ